MSTGCFILGKMKGLTYSQFLLYSSAVATFNRVQDYNSNVSAQRAQGNNTLSYYQFSGKLEQDLYTQGRMLLIQNDPKNADKYTPVPQN